MNSRESALVSGATVFGVLASSLALRFFFPNPRKLSSKLCPKTVPFRGNAHLRAHMIPQNAKGICHGMIIL